MADRRVLRLTKELEQARAERVPTFTHFLDLPILFVVEVAIAIGVAAALTVVVPRLYPWVPTEALTSGNGAPGRRWTAWLRTGER